MILLPVKVKNLHLNLATKPLISKIIKVVMILLFLVTRSFNFGEIPKTTYDFLKTFHNRVIGTAVSGNRNWGTNFGKAGEVIEKEFGIPLVTKFEMGGFDNDIKKTKNFLETFS